MTVAALAVTLCILAGLGVMQILLLIGLPIGHYAWGGKHRVLPRRTRSAAVAAIVLYVAFAVLLLSRAAVLPGAGAPAIVVATWILFAYCALSIGVNAISRSRQERLVQTPISVLLAAGVLVIAMGPTV